MPKSELCSVIQEDQSRPLSHLHKNRLGAESYILSFAPRQQTHVNLNAFFSYLLRDPTSLSAQDKRRVHDKQCRSLAQTHNPFDPWSPILLSPRCSPGFLRPSRRPRAARAARRGPPRPQPRSKETEIWTELADRSLTLRPACGGPPLGRDPGAPAAPTLPKKT